MWVVVLVHPSVAVLIIMKVWLEKYQKFIPRNIMSNKNNFILTLDAMGWRTGRLQS